MIKIWPHSSRVRYRVQLAPGAVESFLSLNPVIRKQLKAGLKELASNPYAGKELQDDLAKFRNYWIKRYRIAYAVVDGEKTLKAYAILDRLVHSAHKIKLTGESMRKKTANLT